MQSAGIGSLEVGQRREKLRPMTRSSRAMHAATPVTRAEHDTAVDHAPQIGLLLWL